MEVVVYPDPRLLQKTAPIAAVTDEVRAKAAEMLRLMYADHGVGLAAPQVGWSVKLFVANPTGDPSQREQEVVLVNPRLVKRSGRVRGEEGCLSFPGIYVEVERAKDVDVEYTDLAGVLHKERWSDFKARVFQHELDHLQNVLLVHRMTEGDKLQHAEALADLRRDFEAQEA
jgi:peptide deformylase